MELKTCVKKPSRAPTMLGPGFRFHPTDEELVQYYLRRKASGKGFRIDAIADVDVYKAEPWDLPYMSKLKTRDLEWYFFSFLDKKYGNGARTNRATEKGYWKTTGKDRTVYHRRQVVGMKKTLVYHCGRAPKGQRSNWVMHEYRLAGSDSETAGVAQDAFVLCRIFQKSGSGPKNGEQYGAPFVEEEWDDNEFELTPQNDAAQQVDFGDNACVGSCDIQKILGSDVPLSMTPVSSDGSHDVEATKPFDAIQNLLVSADNDSSAPKMCHDQYIQNLPSSYDMDAIPVKEEGISESIKYGNSESADDLDFMINELFHDTFENFPNTAEGFIEANDLSNPYEINTGTHDMLAEYLEADAGDESSFYYASDPTMIFGNEDLVSNQTLLPQMNMGKGTDQTIMPQAQTIDNNNFLDAFDEHGPTEYQSDFQLPFIKQASRMLGNIHAPPAFAAEFPSKDAIRRLKSIAQSPSSVHVSSSTIQIRNLKVSGKGRNQSPGKDENLNLVLSFGYSRGDDGSSRLESSVRIVPGTRSCWVFLLSFCILIFSISFGVGSFIGVR